MTKSSSHEKMLKHLLTRPPFTQCWHIKRHFKAPEKLVSFESYERS